MDIGSVARNISIYALPALLAIILHEIAHGWIAEKFGDSTARRAGRITLNPISHIDPIGTVILPLVFLVIYTQTGKPFFFGWAKPVPVNFAALRNPKKDMVWVALSGPATNFVLALLSAILLRITVSADPNLLTVLYFTNVSPEVLHSFGIVTSILAPIALMLCASIFLNVLLMVLNLIPVPPLDGGRIMVGLLPDSAAYSYSKLERYGIMIIFFLIFFVRPAQIVFGLVIQFFINLFSIGAGVGVLNVLLK